MCILVCATRQKPCRKRVYLKLHQSIENINLIVHAFLENSGGCFPLHPAYYTPTYPFSMSRLPTDYKSHPQWYSQDMKVRGKSVQGMLGSRKTFLSLAEILPGISTAFFQIQTRGKPSRLRLNAPWTELNLDSSDDPTRLGFGGAPIAPRAMPLSLPISIVYHSSVPSQNTVD